MIPNPMPVGDLGQTNVAHWHSKSKTKTACCRGHTLVGYMIILRVDVGKVMGGGKNTYGDYSQVFVSSCQNVDVPIRLQWS